MTDIGFSESFQVDIFAPSMVGDFHRDGTNFVPQIMHQNLDVILRQ